MTPRNGSSFQDYPVGVSEGAETQMERLQFRLNAILPHLVYSWETRYAKKLDALRHFPRRFPRGAMANEDNKEMRQVQIKPGQMRFDVEFIVLDGPLDERPVVRIFCASSARIETSGEGEWTSW